MIREFKRLFKDDHIYLKKYVIKALSPLWWIIRFSQAIFLILMFSAFYCLMWLAFA